MVCRACRGFVLDVTCLPSIDDERHLVFECPVFEDLRREHRHLFGQEVAFDMRRFFAHKDQRAVVMYILGCMRLIDIYD